MTSELLNALAQTTLATGFTFLCTAAGAAAVFFMKPGNGRGRGAELAETLSLGFAAGIMIAASVWSLIIPAQEMAQAQGGTPWLAAGSGVAAGALFLKLLDTALPHLHPGAAGPRGRRPRCTERCCSSLRSRCTTCLKAVRWASSRAPPPSRASPAELSSALALALGIGIQNIPEGAAVSLPLAGQGMSRMRAFLFGAFSGIVEPVFGLLVVLVLQTVMPAMPFMLAFATGAMLYVVVEELIPAAHLSKHSDAGTLAVITGFILMMTLDTALG